ncbi:membrane protein insertase YidC [uncultured Alistipes sp.]|uniref:membrane protein insertase YidC n=1 Tax=uncultured Alistipes sp. TaxID=538949 RepID=UPI00260E6106|nr:membrane protein insertase YidC [uncultured Alistipes sp.]
MDKKSLIGIVLIGVIFFGFTIYSSRQQQKYQEAMAAYEAAHPELAQPIAGDSASMATASAASLTPAQPDSVLQAREIAVLGDRLVAAKKAEPRSITVENDVMRIVFSTRGGIVQSVTLKDYTRYGKQNERNDAVELFVPESAKFDLSFFIKNGLNNVKVNTSDYTFTADPVVRSDSSQIVRMRLAVAPDAALEYEYTVYDAAVPSRDYLVDYTVRLVNMAPYMSNQSSIGMAWSNTSYQNERGFKNENMYTTVAYRIPGEGSIDELSMSEGDKEEEISSSVEWIAFKQQFFSSVLIARGGSFSYADVAYSTAAPDSGLVKSFSASTAVPYTAQTEQYDFSFYFGPNKYAVLKKIDNAQGESLLLDRLIPMGWGIIGWVSRWLVIPVFDFLRQYIGSYGWIILILAVLIKIIVSPLTYKSYISQAKMRIIKPEMDALNAKYPRQEDAMKKQQEMMALYKKAGINPMGGCIPLLIQFPILIAMFRFFPSSIELRGQPLFWAHDLSSYDSILNLPFSIPFYGDHVSLFALLMALSTFAFSYISYQQTSSAQPQMAGMKFMMVYLMPIFMLCWFNDYSSGLCYYYLLFNLLTIAQTFLIRRMVDDGKIHAIMEANASKAKNRKKSKFQLRYEELMRQQEAMQRGKAQGGKKRR